MQISFSRLKTLDSSKMKKDLIKRYNSPVKNKNMASRSSEKGKKQNNNNNFLSLKTHIEKQDFKSPISEKADLSNKKRPIRKIASAKSFF